MALTRLANLYGSDKGTVGPGPEWAPHNYTATYEAYLAPLQNAPIALLEIGLGVGRAPIVTGRNTGGASLKMWRDFFPNGRIYGMDVLDASDMNGGRITTFVGDQGSPEDLGAVVAATGPLDVIVDDGSHRAEHQQIALSCLFPHLKRGGVYFIEDLLENGRGDGMTGPIASENVLNTRRVLKQGFAEPNALIGTEWREQIASLEFHNDESLCAIRKAA